MLTYICVTLILYHSFRSYFTTLLLTYSDEFQDASSLINWKGFGRKRLWHSWHSFFVFPWRNREHQHVSQHVAASLWKGWHLVPLSPFSPEHRDWILRPTQPPIQWKQPSFPWANRRDGKSTTNFHLTLWSITTLIGVVPHR